MQAENSKLWSEQHLQHQHKYYAADCSYFLTIHNKYYQWYSRAICLNGMKGEDRYWQCKHHTILKHGYIHSLLGRLQMPTTCTWCKGWGTTYIYLYINHQLINKLKVCTRLELVIVYYLTDGRSLLPSMVTQTQLHPPASISLPISSAYM